MPEFAYQDPFPTGPDTTRYRHLTSGPRLTRVVRGRGDPQGRPRGAQLAGERGVSRRLLPVPPDAPGVAAILDDPEASANDRTVALTLLRNAAVASGFRLPMCQDTGTATIVARKGRAASGPA